MVEGARKKCVGVSEVEEDEEEGKRSKKKSTKVRFWYQSLLVAQYLWKSPFSSLITVQFKNIPNSP